MLGPPTKMAPLKKGEKVFVTHSDGKEYGAKVIDTKPKTVKIHCESASAPATSASFRVSFKGRRLPRRHGLEGDMGRVAAALQQTSSPRRPASGGHGDG